MKSLQDTMPLHNGMQFPCLGFGTANLPNDQRGADAVRFALETGYRLLDTAASYANEESVGQGVRDSGLKRSDVLITTKLANTDHGYEQTLRAFDLSLKRLATDYVDLYLIHWPDPEESREPWQDSITATWQAMATLYRDGVIRAIGVSNFMPQHLAVLLDRTDIVPMVNQIKLCPGVTQDDAVRASRASQIVLEGYSPLGAGDLIDHPVLRELAAQYERTPAQIALRWSLQMGFVPIPKSGTPERIRENAEVFDFELKAGDVECLSQLKQRCKK